ncbi:MAG: hypothetical protein EBY20_04575 [Alphaproteobacteria bacterium]|nr:hypothetical protein [Alphaproteobacteria bacterium]
MPGATTNVVAPSSPNIWRWGGTVASPDPRLYFPSTGLYNISLCPFVDISTTIFASINKNFIGNSDTVSDSTIIAEILVTGQNSASISGTVLITNVNTDYIIVSI